MTYLVGLNRHLLCFFIITFFRLILFSFLLTINHYCENLLWYQSFRCRSVYVRDLATTVPSDILAPVVTWLSAVTVMTFWLKKSTTVSDIIKKKKLTRSREMSRHLKGWHLKKWLWYMEYVFMFPYTLCVLNNVCVKMFSSFLCFIYRAFFCVCIF